MTVTPEILRADQTIRDMLWPFDFAVASNEEYGPVWFDTAPLEPFEIVAQQSSGCVYALIGPKRHVLLATTEGEAGIVAANLKECLEPRDRPSLLAGCRFALAGGCREDAANPS